MFLKRVCRILDLLFICFQYVYMILLYRLFTALNVASIATNKKILWFMNPECHVGCTEPIRPEMYSTAQRSQQLKDAGAATELMSHLLNSCSRQSRGPRKMPGVPPLRQKERKKKTLHSFGFKRLYGKRYKILSVCPTLPLPFLYPELLLALVVMLPSESRPKVCYSWSHDWGQVWYPFFKHRYVSTLLQAHTSLHAHLASQDTQT